MNRLVGGILRIAMAIFLHVNRKTDNLMGAIYSRIGAQNQRADVLIGQLNESKLNNVYLDD